MPVEYRYGTWRACIRKAGVRVRGPGRASAPYDFNICADGPTRGTKDILITLTNSHAEDVACVARIQHMTIGPLVPGEVDIASLAILAKKNKLRQICSFQAAPSNEPSNQLLTNGAKTISSFVRAKARRPTQSGPFFFFCKDSLFFLKPFVSGETANPVSLPVPGSIGNAGMAFTVQNHIHVKFDKIHRSLQKVPRGFSFIRAMSSARITNILEQGGSSSTSRQCWSHFWRATQHTLTFASAIAS